MERALKRIEEIYSDPVTERPADRDGLEKLGLRNITLRPYQQDGVNWLVERFLRGHGCILGDEMGLGKTCQTISFLVYLYGSKKSRGPHLILCPLSVITNWKDELKRFAPKLKFKLYMGDKDTRENRRADIEESKEGNRYPFHIILTTYEICLKDDSFLSRFSWHTLVVDEAHRLKNQNSQLHQILKSFDFEHRILLTGTPVQNNLHELYALLRFVAPGVFKTRYEEEFVDRYTDMDNKKDRTELHTLLQPFILRRVKSEVVKDLPKKTEVILYHGITALQKIYYKAILMKDLEVFESNNPYGPTKTRLMNILMELRKCVNHPYLFDGVEPEPFQLGEHLVEASGKLTLIDQLLSYLKPRGHKVLMFSQMTRMLDIIQDYLGYRGYNYERLDGSVRGEERFLAIQNFNRQEDTFIFLLSTKAGGQGLNLTAADTVIFVDSDFNPQNDLQAAARAHRIGQNRPVRIIRLIGHSTIEEIVLKRAEAKLRLTNKVIEGGQFSLGTTKEKEDLVTDSNIQLQDILKFGVDKLFETEDGFLDDIDFKKILGNSLDGKWQPPPTKGETEDETMDEGEDVAEIQNDDKSSVENMYVFEGKDYSKEPSVEDKKAFQDLVAAEKAIRERNATKERTRRKKNVDVLTGLLPELPRKPRKQLTPEELEERKKKRAETAARKAKEAEELEIRRAQEKKEKLRKLWTKNDYQSANIELNSEGESDEENDVAMVTSDEDGGNSEIRNINYVSGDVTHPTNTKDKDAIIVHCVDDSGSWGIGGLFSAISARSTQPETQYELAKKMKDLALGDTHLIAADDQQSREKGRDWVALIVAQHRDRSGTLSGIKLTALDQGLQRVLKAAVQKRASVHLPRIGYNTPDFNWYGTERLIRKWLAAKGVPTYIYYFPRRRQQIKRRKSSDSENSTNSTKKGKKHRDSTSPVASTSHADSNNNAGVAEMTDNTSRSASRASASSSPGLPDFMKGVSVYFHNVPQSDVKKMKRRIIAYDGDVQKAVDDVTTHIVANCDNEESKKELVQMHKFHPDVRIVSPNWVKDCMENGKRISEDAVRYQINLD